MRTYAIAILGAFFIAACAVSADDGPTFASSKAASTASGAPRVIVAAAPGTSLAEVRALVRKHGGAPELDLGIANAVSAVMPDRAAAKRLAREGGVLRVENDAVATIVAPPGKCSPWPSCKDGGGEEPPPPPPQVTPWGITRTGADQVWGGATGAGVKVVIIDTGIDKDHPDLAVAGGVNFVAKSPTRPADPSKWDDDNGHGTHVAGTVAALDNARDVVGMAPSAELWACKALDRNGSGYVSWIVACIDWAAANGMQVANMSLGTSSDVQALRDAVDNAYAAGVVLVAAAGNSGDGNGATDDVNYPAKYASVIAVAATNDADGTPSWSSEGPAVEVAAPGVQVLSTWHDGGTRTASGTSMASPHVAGAAALLLDADPGLSNACVRGILAASAEDLGAPGHDNFYGHGLINVPSALATPCP